MYILIYINPKHCNVMQLYTMQSLLSNVLREIVFTKVIEHPL